MSSLKYDFVQHHIGTVEGISESSSWGDIQVP